MRPTYYKHIRREVKASFTRFAAIFAIITLSAGFLCGLMAAVPDMQNSMDAYYKSSNLADVFIKTTYGLTEEDIADINGMAGVEEVMPARVVDTNITSRQFGGMTARIYGLDDLCQETETAVNTLKLLEGRMPKSPDECVVEQPGNYIYAFQLGDVLTVTSESGETGDLEDIFAITEYNVVGVISNPFYISNERESTAVGQGGLNAILYVDSAAYSLETYTDAYLRLSFSDTLFSFSEEYEEKADAAKEELASLGKVRSVRRYTAVLSQATADIQEAQETLNAKRMEAEEAFMEAYVKLAKNKKALQTAKTEFAQSKNEILLARSAYELSYADFLANMENLAREMDEGFLQLRSGETALQEVKRGLDEEAAAVRQLEELAAGGTALTPEEAARVESYYSGLAAYNTSLLELQAQRAQLESAQLELETNRAAGEAQFSESLLLLEENEGKIAAAEATFNASVRQLEQAENEYEIQKAEAEEEFSQAQAEIDEASLEISDISMPKWYVLDREANISLVSFSRNVEKVDAITDIFPIFFLLVAALVTITSMTRMVEQDRTQIGTLKALGYTKAAIAAKYILYCGSAGLFGSVAGVLCGFRLLPTGIWNVYASIFHLPALTTYFSWQFLIIVSAVVSLATTLTTLGASYYTLKDKPSLLMQPKAPKAGKRIFLERIGFLWSRLSFSYKATARNIIRYKKHLFMTVLGVAGCTALMLAGFGVRDSLSDIANTQFREIVRYDMEIWLDSYNPENRLLKGFLENDYVKGSLEVSIFDGQAGEEDSYELSVVSVKDPEALSGFVSLRERKTKQTISLKEKQVVMTEMLAITLELEPGDSFTITDDEGETGEFVLGAIAENYVDSCVYMTSEACAAGFGDHSVPNAYLVNYDFPDESALGGAVSALLNSKAVNTVSYVLETKATYGNILNSMNFIVVVLIIAAGSLAVIVLYNLININIEERQRELATLKVLGYHQKELVGYIFREIAILNILGMLLGLALGALLHGYIIRAVEDTYIMFGRNISPLSYFISGGTTLAFSALIALLMSTKLRKIKMADSLKAND